jgi:hypothetical protein
MSGGGLPIHHGHPSQGALSGGGGNAGYRRTGSGSLHRAPSSGGGVAGALLSALQQPQQTALALLNGGGDGGGKGPLLGGGGGGGPPLSGSGGGSGGGATPVLAPLVGWLRALLLLAVVGFVLLDVVLFEAVVARTSSAPRSPALAEGATALAAGSNPSAALLTAGAPPPPPPRASWWARHGGGALVNAVGLRGGGPLPPLPTPGADEVDTALIELPRVLPSQAGAAERAARLAGEAGVAGVGAAALQQAPAAAAVVVGTEAEAESAAASAAAAFSAAREASEGGGGGGKKEKNKNKRDKKAAAATAPPAVTLLLQHGVLPPMAPETSASASSSPPSLPELQSLPAAFRLPAPARPSATVRALATSAVGAAPLVGLRAGAAAAANPLRAPSASSGGGALAGGTVTTETARAAAVSLFGADVFAAEDARAAAGGAAADDDDDDGAAAGDGGRGKKAAKQVQGRRRLPPGFDWRAYLAYNPDVRAFGVNTAATAAGHFLAYGAKEGRLHRRIPAAVRYTACGGLANQHYSHVAALTLAVALGADVILPDAAARDTFAHYFSEDPSKNKVQWRAAPLGSLWEPASAAELMRAAGGNDAALAPRGSSPPDLSLPADAFQTYGIGPPDVVAPAQVVRLEGVYQQALPVQDLVDEARERAVKAAMAAVSGAKQAAVARGEPSALTDPRYDVPPPVIVDLPCALFSVEAVGSPLAAAVARQLRFSPSVAVLADKVVAAMAGGLGGPAEEAAAASQALAAARRAAVEGAAAELAGGVGVGGGGGGGGSGSGGGGSKNTAPRSAAQLLARDARYLRSGAAGFNGLHLRVEADARDWLKAMGGREAFWRAYLDLLTEAGFGTDEQARAQMVAPLAPAADGAALARARAAAANASSSSIPPTTLPSRKGLPLYVATGLPSYADAAGSSKAGEKAAKALAEVRARLARHGARLVFKEDVLSKAELSGLAPDQLALIDFLVLARSRGFVGASASTFSVLVREYRALHGIAPRDTAWLVDCTKVGSEPLFARAAVFAAAGDGGGGAGARDAPVLGSHKKSSSEEGGGASGSGHDL